MQLIGEQGESIDNISCGVYTFPMVGIDENGENQMANGRVKGVYFKPEEHDIYVPGAPEDCPLVVRPRDRNLGSFAVCLGCEYADINLPKDRFDRLK